METDLVSIITPVYNSEKFIKETIKTVQEQTYENWEWILVNDCSTDRSSEIIKQYTKEDGRIKLLNLKTNFGVAIARNIGMEQSNGKYIAFLDADDLWAKEKLEKQIMFMKENKYIFTFTDYEFSDKEGNKTGKIVKVPKKINYKQALKNTTIFTSTVVFNVDKLGKELIQMPNIKSEDTATWWKVLKSGYEGYGLNENLTYYRRMKGTLSSNKFNAIKRIWNLYIKQENLNIFYSLYNFIFYAVNAVRRRI